MTDKEKARADGMYEAAQIVESLSGWGSVSAPHLVDHIVKVIRERAAASPSPVAKGVRDARI